MTHNARQTVFGDAGGCLPRINSLFSTPLVAVVATRILCNLAPVHNSAPWVLLLGHSFAALFALSLLVRGVRCTCVCV